MKLRLLSSMLILSFSTQVFASQPATTSVTDSRKVYVGLFGGGSSANNFSMNQYGTAFYTEANGGPVAVNGVGRINGSSASFFGVQLGYQSQAMLFGHGTEVTFTPAGELEMISMSKNTFNGTFTNNTDRLDAHAFALSYPMNRNIFLVNALVNFSHPRCPIHPYIGFGIGDAVIRINGANAAQINPLEAGVNHYNANPSDSTSTFAGQIKAGFTYDICQYVSAFAEYRWLYLASTQFTFGSTVYPTHVVTSSWQVKMDAQTDNMLDIGLRFNA